jgi:hypothetical protein
VKPGPIFFASRATPAPEAGLWLSRSVHGERGGFVHDALCEWIPQAPPETLLATIDVAAISEGNQLVWLGKLMTAPLVTPPPWERLEQGGDVLHRIAFSVHTSTLFEGTLAPERLHLHAMQHDLLSPSVALQWGVPPMLEPGPLPGDLLLCAYDHAREGRHAEALQAFQSALAIPAVAADLDGAHRYNGACAAARAGQKKLAARWLAEDHQARAEAHSRRTRAALLARLPAAEDAQTDRLFRAHQAWSLADPDLAGIEAAP